MYTLVYRLYLYSNILFFDFDKEIYIIKSVPLIGRRFYFNADFFIELSINRFDFCHITVKCAVNDKLAYIINTILLCNFLNLRLNDFSYFDVEFFAERFNVFFGTHVLKVVLFPFVNRFWRALSDA